MITYDFKVLQYNEFECLTRDLLQEEFGIFIESFKDGRDNGIDLRFGKIKGEKTIVQVKRYKEWNELHAQLTKEVPKVQKLKPTKYLLATSVGLSPQNKAIIMEMFFPYIKSTNDIYGQDDLNNLIGKHPNIEQKYYKLWLASTNVLQQIINKDVVNWSSFELDQIKEQITLYVQNESFRKSYEILKEYRYVIISGIPGIGKTTLARMLSYNILANGYEEFVCITDNLSDGAKFFQKGKKQVFFFDDFLGSNVFEPVEKDFDKKLVSFIDAIKREKDKVFILTTREYILSEAKSRYEKFQINNIEIAKCTVDLSSYSKFIKANILYNHLADADLPDIYIEQILKDRRYKKLIEHPNFNPRIIETYIDRGLWKKYPAEEFMQRFEDFFYKPTMVWQQAFENLDIKARYALLVFASMGKEIYLEDWYTSFLYFCKMTYSQLGLVCENFEWKKIIKVLQDCFIKTINYKGHTIVSYFNPSILDFIVTYLVELKDIQRLLIQNSYYVEQLCTIFRDSPTSFFGYDSYIIITEELYQDIVNRFEHLMSINPMSCELSRWYKGNMYGKRGYNEILFYAKFLDSFPILLRKYEGFIEKNINLDEFSYQITPFSDRANLLPRLDWTKTSKDLNKIIEDMIMEPKNVVEHRDLLIMLDELDMSGRKKDKSLIKTIEEDIYFEIDKNVSDENEAEELFEVLTEIKNLIPYEDFDSDFLGYLEEKKKEFEEPEIEYDDDLGRELGDVIQSDDIRIEEMMTSLREK